MTAANQEKGPPKSQLRLEWVYGYRGNQCMSNLFYTASKELVYFVAGVGIIYNVREHKQRFFFGHDDDIVSLALHPDGVIVATGQVGKTPHICVWDSTNEQTLSILKGGHTHGVGSVGFDKDGSRLVSVGLDDHATVCVWDWRKGKILATTRGHTERIFDIQFNPAQPNSIVSCGVKHIKFWTLSGNTLKAKQGVFGKKGEMQTLLCLAFGSDGAVYSGTLAGDVYVWNDNNLASVIARAHNGSIFSIDTTPDGFATAGKDGCVRLWDSAFKQITKTPIDLTTVTGGYKGLVLRSVCWSSGSVVAGSQASEIFEIPVNDPSKARCVMQGHAEGELWALTTHPTKMIFATGSDDCTARIWNMQTMAMEGMTKLPAAIRSCALHPDGSQLACGLTDGSFVVLKTKDFSEIFKTSDRKEVRHEMKYSPSGEYLAVGSNDNFVDIYAVTQQFKRVGTCSGNSSFITHLDWTEDSKYLQTNSGAAEHLYYRVPDGKQVTAKETIQSMKWASWTGVLGTEANGIWEKYTDTNDVNATDVNFASRVIVTADDFGLVKLFRFPSTKKGAQFRKYTGHSAHVTNCRFSADRSRIITIGGGDHAVFQWRFLDDSIKDGGIKPEQHVHIDSASEGSGYNSSDAAEVDSDVERENQKNYEKPVYKEDLVALKSIKKEELAPGEKRLAAPDDSVRLEFVHGYRGFDCRNNLFYTQNGEIVYHVAAVGIVYNREKNTQRFYTEHTDDILALTVHPIKDYVATGQIGRDPPIHIWKTENMQVMSVLKGQHQRGICALDFSADGKRLVSVGLDDEHSIVVWDWIKGEKLATTRGHKDKIYQIKWNPHDSNKLVTVGVKHIKFWVQAGGGFTSNRGVFGSQGKIDNMMCVTFGKAPETCYTGSGSGSIFIWNGTALLKTIAAHKGGPVFTICFAMDKVFVTGGKDGVVSIWDDNFALLKNYTIAKSSLAPGPQNVLLKDNPPVRSVVFGNGRMLVGTKNSEVIEISNKEGAMNVITQGHMEGELWGLATHPTKMLAVSVSDDQTLRIWDTGSQHYMRECKMLKAAGRCCAWSSDGKLLAVGYKDGSFSVFNADSLKEEEHFQHRKREISDIRFSPDTKYLAVASHESVIDIYLVSGCKRVGVCKGPSSYITHIDWDKQGKLFSCHTGARELLFYEAPTGKQYMLRAADAEKTNWASWTGVLGATCEGIWPPASDVTDVNASSLSQDKALLATGDDFGFVKLFPYPVKGKHAKFKKYMGHSSHVTNVRWACDDRHLVSAGGADTAIMVWAREGAAGPIAASPSASQNGVALPSKALATAAAHAASIDTDTDSEEDGGYDSDVAREKDIDFQTKIDAQPLLEKAGVRPHEQDYEDHKDATKKVSRETKSAPKMKSLIMSTVLLSSNKKQVVNGLDLDLVIGYRGFDCNNNVHYINDGADVVYHAAGTAIVSNVASGEQTFYREHDDDIISLAINQNPKFKTVVATGQIGVNPEIHVWDAMSKQNLSVLKGFHKVGVSALNFSCTGKFILSVGVDSQFSLAVWRWQDGTLIASGPGSSKRIFHGEFRPDSDTQFVTVGVMHVRFWTVAGNSLVSKKGVLAQVPDIRDKPKMHTMLSIAFGQNQVTYTGAMSGDVYIWADNLLTRIIAQAHSGPIFTMFTTLHDGFILTGAKQKKGAEGGCVKLWYPDMKLKKAFKLDSASNIEVVKAASRAKGKIVVGTKESELYQIDEKTGEARLLMWGHGEGELWALACHPSGVIFASGSYDGTVRIWDISKKRMIKRLTVGATKAVHFSADGSLLAVGLKNGGVVLISTNDWQTIVQKRDRGSMINEIKFSPNGQLLAVGYEEACIDLYNVSKLPNMDRIGYCKGLASYVMWIDFSIDNKYLRVSTGAYSNQVFEAPAGTEVKDVGVINKLTWATWTSTYGKEVVGIWPRDSKQADVNCACVSHGGNVIVTGDDFGHVKLFQYPCVEKEAEHTTYHGHSAHVSNIRFTPDDRYVISAGGDDSCLFVWKCEE